MANYFSAKEFKRISVDAISPNPNQPRRLFDEQSLVELAQSIKTFGVITPLSVRKTPKGFELISGERRLRGARLAGLASVPCYILNADDEESSFMAIVENLQRRDLDFFEEALSLRCLIDKYGLTQQQAAEKIGKTQSAVANKLRLLRLSAETVQIIRENSLSERHARALLRLSDAEQSAAAAETAKKNMNVAQTEKYVERILEKNMAKEKETHSRLIIKDVRIFLNTVRRAAELMKRSGVDVEISDEELAEGMRVTVYIPQA